MDLSNIIAKKKTYAKYMLKEITHICKDFEKRAPGSKGEEQACIYMADVLKKDCGCDRADVESFEEHPGSFYGWLYITLTSVLLAIVLLFVGLPIVSAILIVFGLFVALMQFGAYIKLVDFLFPKKIGHNVTAIKKCTGEVKRRIIFNGHPDAAWEWPVNYKLGGVGFESHAIICGVGALYYLVLSIIACAKFGVVSKIVDESSTMTTCALIGLIFVPFLIGLYFMWNKHRVVDGANDNLSGCYMGIAILKALQDAYCNTASDPDAYLYETVAPENIIFGLYEPEKVLERLDAWNREIRVEFLRAIKNMCPGIGAGHLPPEDELPMDTDMTYQLVCATRELDDMWYDFADHAVYVENEFGYPFFRTIVDEHTAACIKANPEAYLIARVTPK